MMNKKTTAYDKPIKFQRPDTNLSTFGFLFSEIIQYIQSKKRPLNEELQKLGENVGVRLFELLSFREKNLKRETKHIEMLKYISSNVWKYLFGKIADTLSTVKEQQYAYLIIDNNPILLKYISEEGGADFIVGILRGMLNSSGFETKKVFYETETDEDENKKEVSRYPSTMFFIQFEPHVVNRETQ